MKLALISVVALAVAVGADPITEHPNPNLLYVGTVDGKSFFMDSGSHSSWEHAHQFCNDNNLMLASIETAEQRDIVLKVLKYRRRRFFWTSAIQEFEGQGESINYSNFTTLWEDTDNPVDLEMFPGTTFRDMERHYYSFSNENCGAVGYRRGNRLSMDFNDCNMSREGILCQT